MQEAAASHTARSVAAHRLEYTRAGAPYGDPAADDELARDVAAGLPPRHTRMHEYLRARTAFFDRVVVNALDQGVTQVVVAAAGYDGRALRYAKPGVAWFEVDHPATQADKLRRLARLGLDTRHVRFVAADFAADPVAAPLHAAGLDPAGQTLVLAEGVAVYLELPVLRRTLAGFRQAVPAGSTLAISVSVGSAESAARRRFQERVAAVGEPARTTLTHESAAAVLAEAGWEVTAGHERQLSAGLLLAHAVADQPDQPGQPGRTRPVPPRRAAAAPGYAAKSGPAASAPASAPASAQPGHAVTADQAAALPLSALLSQALVAFTVEADNEAEHRMPHRTTSYGTVIHTGADGAPRRGPWLTSLLMWANCLRHLPDEGATIAELLARARTGTNLDGMRRWGYVTFTPDPGPGKRPAPDALIRPTAHGVLARETWREATGEVESRWRDRLGPGPFAALRAALAAIAGNLDPALPDCLPILGPGLFTRRDPGRAGRREVGGLGPQVRLPPGGPGPAALGDLPLWALLSRPLLAFALQYEREPGPSLAVGADILRVLAETAVPVRDIPVLGGVSKEAVAMAMGALRQRALVTEGPGPSGGRYRLARLTVHGAVARDDYPALTAGIEEDWRTRFGDQRLTALRRALEPLAAGDPPRLFAGLDPYPDNWRAQVKPPRTLPHYPMTLHRGGYPDGS